MTVLVPQELYNTVIDEAHKKLFNRAYIIANLCKNMADVELIVDALGDFRMCLFDHFRVEETIARAAGLEGQQEHERRHAMALTHIDGLTFVAARTGGREIIERVVLEVLRHEVEYDDDFLHKLKTPEASGVGENLINWGSHFEIGAPDLDAQHAMMAILLNKIYEAAIEGDPYGVLNEYEEGFLSELSRHFYYEEMLLSGDYVKQKNHRDQHQGLLLDLKKYFFEAMTPLQSAALCRDYLRYWFVDHILNRDALDFGEVLLFSRMDGGGVFDISSLSAVC